MRTVRAIASRTVGVALAFTAVEAAATQSEPPFGLWVWSAAEEKTALEVLIERGDGKWRGAVDGEPVSVSFVDGRIHVAAPQEQGFVGELTDGGSAIRGHWTQTSSSLGYGAMVTPTIFSALDDNRWVAHIALQPRPFRVFLDVFEDEHDGLVAVIRNPERNEIMRATRFQLERSGNRRWVLVAGSGDRQIRQSLKEVADGLELDHRWFGSPLTLRRAEMRDVVSYFPRDPSADAARYTPPPRLDDGWEVASAEDAGFDRAALDALVTELSTADPRSRRPRLIHSLLVAHNGQLVFEEYFYGHDRETVHDTRSLGKVFAPVLLGALRHKGVDIDASPTPIPDVLAAAGEELEDSRKAAITLGQLMSFTSGLDCDDNDPTSIGSEDRMWEQREEADFWLYTARLPLLHDPGTRYAYCSGSINLVGASVRAAGGKPIVDLFDELIAVPLEFGPYHWNLAPNGAAYLGGGPYMRPRDILKIGAVFAANGKWNGKQVINPAWVEESTTAVMDITAETTGMTPEEFGNNYFGGAAAYEWRIDEVRVGDRVFRSYEATGNGGQILLVVPDLDIIVLFTGGNYRYGSIWGRWRQEIVGGHIAPAMRMRR